MQAGYTLKAPVPRTYVSPSNPKTRQTYLTNMQKWKFVLNLPLIVLEDDNSCQKCYLCRQNYNRDFQVCGAETAVQLPCGCCLGHLCGADFFSPYRKAYAACPICRVEIPELAAERPSSLPRDAGLSQPTYLPRTSEWLRSQQTARAASDEEADTESLISELETDTGLHFFKVDHSIETLSSTLTDYSRLGKEVKQEGEGRIVFPRKQKNDGASTMSEVRDREPVFRGWGIARAAIKAVDLVAKRGGA